ncbi:MAG: DUF805 domain-containing protein [Bacteroidales bacterium]|nr:DUF805 domain-containing protein [Bacteroidales bacterium]
MNEYIENFKEIVTNKYAQFSGRAGKAEFWQYILVFVLINVAFSLLSSIFSGVNFLRMLFMIISAIVSLALLIPTISVGVRRMHDIGKGGGWVLVNLIPFIGTIWFIILAIKESDGPNRFDK